MPIPACLTLADAARRVGVSDSTIERWIRQGKGPTVTRLAGVIRVREDHLLAWLDQNATPSGHPGQRAA